MLPLAAGLVAFRRNSADLRWLVLFYAIATLVETISRSLSSEYKNNIWLLNIYLLIEGLVFVNMLAFWHGRSNVREAAAIFSVAFASFWAVSIFYFGSLFVVNNAAFTAAALLNVAFSGLALYRLSGVPGPSLLRNYRFWFAAGILIFYSVDVTLFSIFDLITRSGGATLRAMYAIHSVLNIFANTIYAVGFLCTLHPLKLRSR